MENLIKPILHNTLIGVYWEFVEKISENSIYAKMDSGEIEINLIYINDLWYLQDELDWFFDRKDKYKTIIVYENQINEF